MGYAMNADVMIGGIESEEMLDYVRELNCRYAQGYHIGKPQRLADIINQTVLTKILSIVEDDSSVTQITLQQLEADADI
jgi:EAL domain-containing protein (putative c-di-GMP-specific phosphodiesterase class I)